MQHRVYAAEEGSFQMSTDTPTPLPAAARRSDRDPGRVQWMELFFDLIFVALVGQLARGLHANPTLLSLAIFLALFATVWWSWVNLTFIINIMSWLSQRQLALIMLGAMLAVGAIAVAAPEATTDRAWLFAAGNAAFRLLLLGLWVARSWNDGRASRLRLSAYNGATALLWAVSIWVPQPWNFALWGLALVVEITLIIASNNSWAHNALGRLNVDHLSERFGLLVVIVLGESVLSIVVALDGTWTPQGAIAGVLALAVVACLAWAFFMFGTTAMSVGLEKLRAEGNTIAIRDTVAFLPFLLVAGVTAVSVAASSSIRNPDAVLPFAAALSLWGGITLFFLTNAIISVRFGTAPAAVLRWAVPALVLVGALGALASVLTAMALLGCAVLALAVITASAEISWRRGRT